MTINEDVLVAAIIVVVVIICIVIEWRKAGRVIDNARDRKRD